MDLSKMVNEIINNRGDRLRSERLRLGLSQSEFAGLFGKKIMTVSRYEKGMREMGVDDLEALHRAEVDIWFVLTGERTRSDLLTDEAKELLLLWDQVEPAQHETLLTLVRNFAESFKIKN
ncbi:helix-turn-helix domain-containing protein [Acinetobacter sp. WZC-1]|uniref:helix-turn-helix domain-containing protein n=1 Tax=Acinetobacter sp. WZC-1 TaxID=3459034 RepID=UPI00403D8CDB